ncbi:hypothetical protein PCYB_005590 [Plasmodium cynomolgi strain B]|uniref:CYIR protein n=1 Tax=Plasmodium cynomolgi (strain B) TaxID=1120755 RepID=K6V376_PLACD|nr:hypothetical protein PCYB_005590 [Plasmodium cynomolgi strain B]GAB69810.1 hypothetical protein PCYB_005590 [Plasmodium cynomolgi strain B]
MTSGVLYRVNINSFIQIYCIRRCLRRRHGNSRNIVSNLNVAYNGLLDYTAKSFNPYSGDGEEQYIGYHPS